MPKPIQFDIYIRKVGKQIHPGSQMSSDFLNQINRIIVRLGEQIAEKAFQLTEKENTKTIDSRTVLNATRLILLNELSKYAVSQGIKAVTKYSDKNNGKGNRKKKVSKSAKAGLQFSVSRCRQFFKKYNKRIAKYSDVYLAAVLEYITTELTELSGNVARDNRRSTMKIRDLYIAIQAEYDLNDMMHRLNMGITGGGNVVHVNDAVIQAYEKSKKKNK
jgi:histone H2A